MRVTKRLLILLLSIPGIAFADIFTLISDDLVEGEFMSRTHEFKGFGCSGGNMSPQLSWRGAPKETQAFAIQVFDPDAPTGSGWWHWQLVNIPKSVTMIKSGAGDISKQGLPLNAMVIKNDYGVKGFGGACPPKGDGVHRYQFKVYALSAKLDIPEDASNALVSYMVNHHTLASSTIEALYKR